MPMGNVSVRRIALMGIGKAAVIEADFDASYATGGETLDLAAFDPDVDFAFIHWISPPWIYTTAAPPTQPARTLVADVRVLSAAQPGAGGGAPGTLLCLAFSEDGTSGVTTQVAATTDLSTVRCRFLVVGE